MFWICHSFTCSLSAAQLLYLLRKSAFSLKHARKTNVCFAAACFSFACFILSYFSYRVIAFHISDPPCQIPVRFPDPAEDLFECTKSRTNAMYLISYIPSCWQASENKIEWTPFWGKNMKKSWERGRRNMKCPICNSEIADNHKFVPNADSKYL